MTEENWREVFKRLDEELASIGEKIREALEALKEKK